MDSDEPEDDGLGEDPDDDLDDLSFDHAGDDLAPTACGMCSMTIADNYFEADGQVVCPGCAHRIRHGEIGHSRRGRALRALGLGSAAALVGALVWYGIAAATGYEIGLIAIAVGFGVGFGVRRGSRDMGGWFYQTLAMVLTYVAIVSTYVPGLTEGIVHPEDFEATTTPPTPTSSAASTETDPETGMPLPGAPGGATTPEPEEPIPFVGALIVAIIIAPFAPFLMGFENIIGLALIAFALWEAWRLNKRPVREIAGPFRLHDDPDPAIV